MWPYRIVKPLGWRTLTTFHRPVQLVLRSGWSSITWMTIPAATAWMTAAPPSISRKEGMSMSNPWWPS